ncbi:MAG: hypothetical protein AAF662_01490 [Pseudomonadota bacterium]
MPSHHRIPLADALVAICEEIVVAGKPLEIWAAEESDDQFQRSEFCGGFDATEGEFTFSYYAPHGVEYWFQLSLEQVGQVAQGMEVQIDGREAST